MVCLRHGKQQVSVALRDSAAPLTKDQRCQEGLRAFGARKMQSRHKPMEQQAVSAAFSSAQRQSMPVVERRRCALIVPEMHGSAVVHLFVPERVGYQSRVNVSGFYF